MNAMRRILAGAMTLSLTACLAFPAFGATYDVQNETDVQNAVANPDKNTGDDREVILNMQNDIGDVGTIDTNKDWTYTFKGNGNTLGHVDTAGQGKVEINANVDSATGGVYAKDSVQVTVNGNITTGGNGVHAEGYSSVTVKGDIQSDATGVWTGDDAHARVEGKVTADTGVDAQMNSGVTVTKGITTARGGNGGNAVSANGSSSVTVDGDIISDADGLYLRDGVSATVNGDIKAVSDGNGVYANGNSTVTVTGNVSSKDGNGVKSEAGDKITVKGNISSEGGDGVNVLGNGPVTVTGNVSSEGGDGVNAGGNGLVTVTGDISSGKGDAVKTGGYSSVKVTGDVSSRQGNGLNVVGEGPVKVKGNVSSGGQGNAVVAAGGPVTVTGNVSSEGGDGVKAGGNGLVTVKGNVSSEGGDAVENGGDGLVTVTGDVSSGRGNGVKAGGNGTVEVTGNVSSEGGDGVKAGGRGKVTVTGNVSSEDGDGVNSALNDTVTVNGNVSSGKGNGVNVQGRSPVTVNGNVTGYDAGVRVLEGTVSVSQNVTARNGNGITAEDNSTVTVGGDVKSEKEHCAGIDAKNATGVTVRGSVTSLGDGVKVSTYVQAPAAIKVSGNVTAGEHGLYMEDGFPENTGKIEVGGNVTGLWGNVLKCNGQMEVDVKGDTITEGYGPSAACPAYKLCLIWEQSIIKLVHHGSILCKNPGSNAVIIEASESNPHAVVTVNGNITLPGSDKGIRINDTYKNLTADISLKGIGTCPVYAYEGEADPAGIHITGMRPVTETITAAEQRGPVGFRSEDLEGNPVACSGRAALLVYFDPADPASVAELQKGQEAFEGGSTVYAVCMTEDYEAARAAMAAAGAKYPVLKLSDSLRGILTGSGKTEPTGVRFSGSILISPETTETRIIGYEEFHPELEIREPVYH